MKQIQQHTLQVAVALTADGACMAGICLASACLPQHQAVVLAGIGCFIVAAVSILWLSARRMHQGTSARSELDQTLRHMQEIQLQKRKEQLNALQNQINPHFLYNTLDTIRGLAIERGAMDVADIVATLSSMFRYSMDYAAYMVPLCEELDHLNSYLKIQALRFPRKFTFHRVMECDPGDLHRIQMPKLVLQPIVENIFTHAFRKLSQGGQICLRLQATDVDFRIIVSDNGTGMEDERVLALNRMFRTGAMETSERGGAQGSIALYNINSRIRMYCGDTYGLHIASTADYGSEVTLTLPLPAGEVNHEA